MLLRLCAEIKNVENVWAARDLNPSEMRIENSHTINNELTLHIISFRVMGMKEFAAVLDSAGNQPLPFVFYIGGYGTDQEPVNSVEIKLAPNEQPLCLCGACIAEDNT